MSGLEQTYILVVDDLPEKRLAYEAVLEDLGQHLVLVDSGAEALKQVLQRDFAVILLDVNMPDMDGFETARIIRSRKRSSSTPIIFLTAFTDEVRTAEGYATGAVDYLPTPTVPEILRAKVRVFVELFQMRQQVARQAEEQARLAASEDAHRRLTFSAEAGAILGRSLQFDATLHDVVSLPVPILGDIGVVTCSARGNIRQQTVISRVDPSGNRVVAQEELETLPPDLARAVRQSLVTGQRVDVTEPNGISGLVLPLQARGRTFAALGLSRAPSGGTYTENDIAMAVSYVWRSANALDNTVLYHELQVADHQKNEFLSMLAHELRNPLAPIRNAAQLLGLRATDEPDLQWIREVIERQVVQMVRLVDDLLDISRITRGKIRLQREPVELASIVALAVETSKPLIDAHHHSFSVSLPTKPVWLYGDLARLAQVLTNLLNNAAKYTEDGGEIWLNAFHDDKQATISVGDSGIGIPDGMLSAVFDLFTQVNRTLDRSQGGLGIGLTLVRQLVEMHGGTVSASSEGPGRGSVFTVALPLHAGHTAIHPLEPSLDLITNESSQRILLVDDNRDSTETLARLLKLAGHEVHTACDGPSGLAAAQVLRPTVILLDIGLPGMDGYAVAEQLRRDVATRDAMLIAVTGYGQPQDELRALQAGFDYHLTKPLEIEALNVLLSHVNPSRGPDRASESVTRQ